MTPYEQSLSERLTVCQQQNEELLRLLDVSPQADAMPPNYLGLLGQVIGRDPSGMSMPELDAAVAEALRARAAIQTGKWAVAKQNASSLARLQDRYASLVLALIAGDYHTPDAMWLLGEVRATLAKGRAAEEAEDLSGAYHWADRMLVLYGEPSVEGESVHVPLAVWGPPRLDQIDEVRRNLAEFDSRKEKA